MPPVNDRLGVRTGKPLADVRELTAQLRKGAQRWGELPPGCVRDLAAQDGQLVALQELFDAFK